VNNEYDLFENFSKGSISFSQISTKSAPPLEEINIMIHLNHYTLIPFSIPARPCDTYASVTGTFTDWTEYTMTKSYVDMRFDLIISFI
jgi:hypothetical protein